MGIERSDIYLDHMDLEPGYTDLGIAYSYITHLSKLGINSNNVTSADAFNLFLMGLFIGRNDMAEQLLPERKLAEKAAQDRKAGPAAKYKEENETLADIIRLSLAYYSRHKNSQVRYMTFARAAEQLMINEARKTFNSEKK